MNRLCKALALISPLQVGVTEGIMLSRIHLHVETPVSVLAQALQMPTERAGALIGVLRRKGLIERGKPWPRRKPAPGQRATEITWRLKPHIRAQLDHFEATGTLPS